jgi:mRNA-degrading endonuclease RelE of RelBE toxin-antitoxin system
MNFMTRRGAVLLKLFFPARRATSKIRRMVYEILVHELAAEEIANLRAYDQRRVLEAIEHQLTHEPAKPTRRRKCLIGVLPSFEHVPPVWELRVGSFRVFYDVDDSSGQINVRAVRRKDPSQRTQDIT